MTIEDQFQQSHDQPANACAIIPLGGLGEIGKNMLVLECEGQLLIIDAGLAFPTEEQPGIDLIIPDVSYILEKAESIVGLILTHGHEDHIGGVPFLLKQLSRNLPIYGTRMTLGMLQNKLEEHHLLSQVELRPIEAGQQLVLGPFEIEFIRVTHSIVDGVALGIKTPAGRLVHTGDFKLDPTPVDNQVTDLAAFGAWGREGVDLLLADSTNVEREGYTLSEREVGVAFDEIVRDAEGRVVIACFSSNIHRFQQVVNTALKFQRKIGVLGLSMVKNMRTAQELGYLNIPANLWLKWSEVAMLPPKDTLVLTTGSQGEPNSALARAAVGEHQDLRLQRGDTVVISARTIPGNERRIGTMINQLFHLGAQVQYERVSEIHVSGHAAREELKIIHRLVNARHFMPVHGETRHLVHHAALAHALGYDPENIFILENGDRLVLTPEGVSRGEPVPSGRVLVDGKGMGDVDQVVLRDRKHLAQDGMVVVVLGLDRQQGEVISGPDILSRGISETLEQDKVREEMLDVVRQVLAEENGPAMSDPLMIQDQLRRALKKYFKKKMMRFPMIVPVVMEV